ncbi:hypothetical protein ACHAQA_002071 [Verticillium albo-atrum]
MRSNFEKGAGYLVAYPFIGGVVLSLPSSVDLKHLRIDDAVDTERASNAAEEDDLATRMLLLGAKWWPDWATYAVHQERVDEGLLYDFHFPPTDEVGYPSTGGVWTIRFSPDARWFGDGMDRERTLPPKPRDWEHRMRKVKTMDEKCQVLKESGATFYEKVEDCASIAKTIEEGKESFRPYRDWLQKMDNVDYKGVWLTAGAKKLGKDEAKDIYYSKQEQKVEGRCIVI